MAYTSEQKAWLLQQSGYDPEQFDVSDDGFIDPKPAKVSAQPAAMSNGMPQAKVPVAEGQLATFGKEAIHAIPATVAGGLGAAGGMKLGAAAGAAIGAPLAGIGAIPGAAIGGFIGGVGGAMAAGMGASAIQEKIEQEVAPEFVAQRQANLQANPWTGVAGRLVVLPAGGMNFNALNVGKAVTGKAGHLANVGIGTALGAGIPTGMQVAQGVPLGEALTSPETIEGAIGGAFFNQPNKLIGQRLGFHPVTETPRIVDPFVANERMSAIQKEFAARQNKGFEDQLQTVPTERQWQFEQAKAEAAAQEAEAAAEIAKQDVRTANAEVVKQQAEEVAANLRKEAKKQKQLGNALGAKGTPEAIMGRGIAEGGDKNLKLESDPLYVSAEEGRPIVEGDLENSRAAKMRETLEPDPLQDEGDAIQDRLERKNQDATDAARTPEQIAYEQALAAHGLTTEIDPISLAEAGAHQQSRGVDQKITPGLNDKGVPVKGTTWVPKKDSPVQRIATEINPELATLDTPGHEGMGHAFFDFLRKSPHKADRDLMKRYQMLAENTGVIEQLNKARAAQGKKPLDFEEYAATQQGFESIMRHPKMSNEGNWKQLYRDTKARVKAQLGKADEADIRRVIDYKWHNMPAFEKYFKIPGGVVKGADVAGTRLNSEAEDNTKKLEDIRKAGVGEEANVADVEPARQAHGILRDTKNEELLRRNSEAEDMPADYRKVKLKKADGTEEEVYFNDKFYDMGEMGKFASIARMTEKGLSHGATKPGDSIEELPKRLNSEVDPEAVRRRNVEPDGRIYYSGNKVIPTYDIVAKIRKDVNLEGRHAHIKILEKLKQENPDATRDEILSLGYKANKAIAADSRIATWDEAIQEHQQSIKNSEQYLKDIESAIKKKSTVSPRVQEQMDKYAAYEEELNKTPLAERQAAGGRKNIHTPIEKRYKMTLNEGKVKQLERDTKTAIRGTVRWLQTKGSSITGLMQDDIDNIMGAVKQDVMEHGFDADSGSNWFPTIQRRVGKLVRDVIKQRKLEGPRVALDRELESGTTVGELIEDTTTATPGRDIVDKELKKPEVKEDLMARIAAKEEAARQKKIAEAERLAEDKAARGPKDETEVAAKPTFKAKSSVDDIHAAELDQTEAHMDEILVQSIADLKKDYADAVKDYGAESDEVADIASDIKRAEKGLELFRKQATGSERLDLKKFERRNADDERSFMTSSERVLRDVIKGPQTVGQVIATLKNKIPPAEFDMLEKAGLRTAFNKTVVRPDEVVKWIQENGPRAEVHSYGMDGKVSEAKKEYDALAHNWYDAQPALLRQLLDKALNPEHNSSAAEAAIMEYYAHYPDTGEQVVKSQIEKAVRYKELNNKTRNEPKDTSPRATSAYNSVSALPTNEPMPEWTATKSGKNVQRVDVVIPHDYNKMRKELNRPEMTNAELEAANYARAEHGMRTMLPELWRQDDLHENLPNTPIWNMIQYKTGPKGEKIAVIVENQGSWIQAKHAYESALKKGKTEQEAYAASVKAGSGRGYRPNQDHPLLQHAQRLGMKAAIEQARKEGATHIMVSDAETAMMTEGHDAHSTRLAFAGQQYPDTKPKVGMWGLRNPSNDMIEVFPTKELAENYKRRNDILDQVKDSDFNNISQEPGMRFNYDTALPRIAEELTGSKGEKVSLGEHKNAYQKNVNDHVNAPTQAEWETMLRNGQIDQQTYNARVVGEYAKNPGKVRDNLIFRNPDGTPKTDVSGMMFKLPAKRTEPFSYFERRNSDADDASPLYSGQELNNFIKFRKLDFENAQLFLNREEPNYAGAERAKQRLLVNAPKELKTLIENTDFKDSNAVEQLDKTITKIIPSLFERRNSAADDAIHISGIMPEVEKLRKISPVAGAGAHDFLTKFRANIGAFEQTLIRAINKARPYDLSARGLKDWAKQDNADNQAVVKYRNAKQDGDEPGFELTPVQQKINEAVEENLLLTHTEREAREGLATGKGQKEHYLPAVMNREATHTIAEKMDSAAFKKYREDFVEYRTSPKRLEPQTEEGALEDWKTIRGGFTLQQKADRASQFGAIDKAMGKGLPVSMRETNLQDLMSRFNKRNARRIAYYDAIESKPEVTGAFFDKEQGVGSTAVGKNVVEDIFGIRDYEEGLRNAASGLVRAGMMGTLTGAKDVLSGQVLGLQHMGLDQVLPAKIESLKNWRSNYERAIKSGVIRHSTRTLESGDTGQAKIHQILGRAADIMNVAQGRTLLENVSRTLNFGEGVSLTQDALTSLTKGQLTGVRREFLENFMPDWKNYKKGDVPESAISEAAARYVESVQGGYDLRGLPSITQKGSLALPLSLARWNIEKFNNFTKHVVTPATKGNYRPLLMSTVGMLIGGAAVNALVEEITGRKSRVPSFKEASESKDSIQMLGYKLAALASMSGYTGVMGDVTMAGLNYHYGNKVQTWSNPLLSGLGTVAEEMGFLTEALASGDLPKATDVISMILSDHLQAYRLAEANLSSKKKERVEETNKRRDLKVYEMGEGLAVAGSEAKRPNPLTDKDAREFKQTDDMQKAMELIGPLIQQAIEKSEGNPERLKEELSKLKRNSYQTVPSPERSPMKFAGYTDWMNRTQGQDETQKRITDYMIRNAKNKAKSSMVPSL